MDTSEDQIMMCVNHEPSSSHLYISDVNGTKFTLSLEDILYFNPNGSFGASWLRYVILYCRIPLNMDIVVRKGKKNYHAVPLAPSFSFKINIYFKKYFLLFKILESLFQKYTSVTDKEGI